MKTKSQCLNLKRIFCGLITGFIFCGVLSVYISANSSSIKNISLPNLFVQKYWNNNFKGLFAVNATAAKSEKKNIALTFDDGPNGKYTEQVLDILKKNNIKVTFFVCGDSTALDPDLVKEEYDMGNEIGNHTFSHPNLAKLSDTEVKKELTKANDEIYKAINKYPVLFRPPYGSSSARVNQILSQLGFKKITWDYMVDDYDIGKTTADKIASQVISHAHSGAIIDMHDGGGNREKTIAALPIIIAELKKQNYDFVTVSAIVKIDPYRK